MQNSIRRHTVMSLWTWIGLRMDSVHIGRTALNFETVTGGLALERL